MESDGRNIQDRFKFQPYFMIITDICSHGALALSGIRMAQPECRAGGRAIGSGNPNLKQMANLGVPLQRSDDRAQWQNPCDTKRFPSLPIQMTQTGRPTTVAGITVAASAEQSCHTPKRPQRTGPARPGQPLHGLRVRPSGTPRDAVSA